MNKTALRGNLLLALAAFIWGVAFVAQDAGMNYVGPFTFNAARMMIGSAVLLIFILYRKTTRRSKDIQTPGTRKALLVGGIVCGIVLFVAGSLQQLGIAGYPPEEAAAGKAGFITALYIVMVPVIAFLLGKKARVSVWISVVLAMLGMYLLCVKGNVGLSLPDFYLILSALCYSGHILVIDYFSEKADCVMMSGLQLFVAGLLSGVAMIVTEKPTLSGLHGAWIPILYTGILSCGVAYTLQVVGQKETDPSVASLIMSMESVFAALAGWLISHEHFTGRELSGCALVFIAVLLAQMDLKVLFRKKSVLVKKQKHT